MKVDITEKHENPLLGRQEAKFSVKEAGSTPSRKELRVKIAALLGADEKNLVVDVLGTRYGTTEVSGKARVYKSEKELKRLETKQVIERNFGRQGKPKAKESAAPAPEANAAEKKK